MSKCCLNSKEWPCFLEDQNCQTKNKNWTCIHELKCLLIYKKIEDSEVLNYLCEKLAEDKDFSGIGNTKKVVIKESCISSIKQKIYNIHSLLGETIEGLGSRSNNSETTEKIVNECKDWTIEKLEQEITKIENEIVCNFSR